MNKDLMNCTSHCKFCNELAEDCNCGRGKEIENAISQEHEKWIGREYDDYINRLLGDCGHRQPTDPITTCDINGKHCLLEENLPCVYLQEMNP